MHPIATLNRRPTPHSLFWKAPFLSGYSNFHPPARTVQPHRPPLLRRRHLDPVMHTRHLPWYESIVGNCSQTMLGSAIGIIWGPNPGQMPEAPTRGLRPGGPLTSLQNCTFINNFGESVVSLLSSVLPWLPNTRGRWTKKYGKNARVNKKLGVLNRKIVWL